MDAPRKQDGQRLTVTGYLRKHGPKRDGSLPSRGQKKLLRRLIREELSKLQGEQK